MATLTTWYLCEKYLVEKALSTFMMERTRLKPKSSLTNCGGGCHHHDNGGGDHHHGCGGGGVVIVVVVVVLFNI